MAPWAVLVATYLIYAIGRMSGKRTGMLAALLYLTTPILFLGADSGLIDGLPALGLTLVLCTIISSDTSPNRLGILLGLALGAALWTHSQAVLLIPLSLFAVMVQNGFRKPRELLAQVAIILVIATAIGFWPYWQNFKRIGALISDNPAVFAMPELDWVEYFRMSRDFDSWPEKIQYGILKGWFAFEAYSMSFWFMSVGVLLYVVHLKRTGSWKTMLLGQGSNREDAWRPAMIAVLVCYFGGVVTSTLMGIDLMIKTERYFLIIMPAVALFAGWGIAKISTPERRPKFFRKLTAVMALPLIAALLIAQLLAIGSYRWKTLGLSFRQIGLSLNDKITHWPPYGAISFLRDKISPESLILSLKPSDMYYTNRRMLSFLDTRLLPFYQERDAIAGWEKLRTLGVTHIYIPDYSMPPMYNSILSDIMGRPDLSHLIYSHDGYQIYELTKERIQTENELLGPAFDLSPGIRPWIQEKEFVFGGRKRITRYTATQSLLKPGEFTSLEYHIPLFLRDWSITARSDSISLPVTKAEDKQPREYRLTLELEGHAFAQIYLTHLDIHSNQLVQESLGGIALGQRYPKRLFIKRFFAAPDISSIRVEVEHRGDTKLRISRAVLSPVL